MTVRRIVSTILLVIDLCGFSNANGQDKNYEEWYLKTKDSLNIYVKEIKGGRDTVIIVHGGFGSNHDYLLDVIQGLEKKFHFIFYDQRGSLLSPAPIRKLNFPENVNDLFRLVSQLKLKKTKLLCHSMGTLVGMEFTKQHPDMVSTLVLTGCVPLKVDSIGALFSAEVTKNLEYLANRAEVANHKKYYEANWKRLTDKEKTEYWRVSFAAVNIYDIAKWRLVKGGQIYYNKNSSVMVQTVDWKFDYRALINRYNTTIIQGQYDFGDFEAKNHLSQIKGFTNIELKLIPNAGHNSWIDNPELFRRYLKEGLNK